MPHNEDAYSHPNRSMPQSGKAVHQRSGSLTNLARLPGVARAKLQHSLSHNPFVRFIEDNDGQDKDENDIYRQKASMHIYRSSEKYRKWTAQSAHNVTSCSPCLDCSRCFRISSVTCPPCASLQ